MTASPACSARSRSGAPAARSWSGRRASIVISPVADGRSFAPELNAAAAAAGERVAARPAEGLNIEEQVRLEVDGAGYAVALSPLWFKGWQLAIIVPEAEFLAEIERTIRMLAVGLGLFLLARRLARRGRRPPLPRRPRGAGGPGRGADRALRAGGHRPPPLAPGRDRPPVRRHRPHGRRPRRLRQVHPDRAGARPARKAGCAPSPAASARSSPSCSPTSPASPA